MIEMNDIHSLTDFKRDTARFLRRLKRTGRPAVLTLNGKAELVVHDAASYQKLLDAIDRAEAIAGIRNGLEDVRAGRTRPLAEALESLRRKHEPSR